MILTGRDFFRIFMDIAVNRLYNNTVSDALYDAGCMDKRSLLPILLSLWIIIVNRSNVR